MIMSIRILRYSKKIGVFLAALLIGVCSGISTVSAAGDLGSSRARAGIKRAAVKRPAIKRPAAAGIKRNAAAANLAAFNRPAVRPIAQIAAQRPFARPIEINQVVVDEEEDNVNLVVDPCFVPEVAFVVPGCNVVVNAEAD